jgi:3-deoxy-D-manno-octulosonic-acid transferase
MTTIVLIIYNLIFVPLLFLGVQIAGLFNAKIRSGLTGRRQLFSKLKETLKNRYDDSPRLWMHCSSAGEYEQGQPIISLFQKKYPKSVIVVSFFSPSGYEHVKLLPNVIKTYLPIDSFWHAKMFINIIKPNVACVIRHDIWPNFQFRLQRECVPSILVDASISDEKRGTYLFFRSIVKILFSTFDNVLAISEEQKMRVLPIYPQQENLSVSGDTRYDQVLSRTQELHKIEMLVSKQYFIPSQTIVVGSSWPSDEKYLLPALDRIIREYPNFRAVLVPHEVNENNLASIEEFFAKASIEIKRYSALKNDKEWNFKILLVDEFGMLANLYALSGMAYVGGGFGLGVNSVLEPAAHGCGVVFGPRHLNVAEAKKLIEYGGAQLIANSQDIYNEIKNYLTNPAINSKRGQKARQMVEENLGASLRTLNILEKYLTH